MITWHIWYLISGGVDICGRMLSTLVVRVGKKMWKIQNKSQYSIQWYSIISKGLCFKLHEIKRCLLLGSKLWKKSYDKPRQHIKKQRHYISYKGPYSQSYGFSNTLPPDVKKIRFTGLQRVGHNWTAELNWTDGFSSSHVWMQELDNKNGWAMKNWCLRTVMLEKILKCPLDCKEIKPGNSKGNQLWIFIGRTDTAPVLWLPDVKCQLIEKRPWCWERLKSGGEGDDRGWDGWMAWPTQWTWVWANSGRWWRKGKPGVLQSMGSQRIGQDWVTEQQQIL